MPRKLLRLLFWTLVSSTLLLGQDPLYTLRVDVPWVTVDVTVTDPSGKTVNDLRAGNFQVFEDGVLQEVHAFAPVSAPYHILLLFDRSGSTEHKWQFMQRAVAGFIDNLRTQDQIAIDSFDSDLMPILRWTSKGGVRPHTLSELIRPGDIGGTAFYSSLETVLRKEFKAVTGRRTVVVLTDGRDTAFYKQIVARNRILPVESDRGFQKAVKAAREQRIPIYFVAINTDLNLEPNVSGGDEFRNLKTLFPKTEIPENYLRQVRAGMESLASVSNGRLLYPTTIEDIVPLYSQIGRELGTAYSLAYISSNSKSDGSSRRIEVRTANGTLKVSQSRTTYIAK